MGRTRATSFAIAANGFADGPAQALREYLGQRGADVHAVWHPLGPEDGGVHVVETWTGGELSARRRIRLPGRPPVSYAVDPFVPLRHPAVDVWFGFNPLACARGIVARGMRRTGKVVLWSVDFVPDRFGAGTPLTRLYDRLDRLCCQRSDARIELTTAARDARNGRHRLAARARAAHVVPMGAWVDRVPRVDAEAHRHRRVVQLSHLVRRQGTDLLLDAIALVRSSGVTADIVGGGPLETSLRVKAQALGLDDVVTFHGFVADHRDVERILADASLGVAPYRPGEGTFTTHADPGKVKSYVAAGLPVLLTDVPPNAHELARDGGAEIVEFDASAVAGAITRILDSPAEWKRRSSAAVAYATRFDWTALLDDLMEELGVEVVGRR